MAHRPLTPSVDRLGPVPVASAGGLLGETEGARAGGRSGAQNGAGRAWAPGALALGLRHFRPRRWELYRSAPLLLIAAIAALGLMAEGLMETWSGEEHLSRAYEAVAEMHNALGITPPLGTEVSPFHSRPYPVIHAERCAAAIDAAITDPEVRSIPIKAGSVDQVTDNTAVLGPPEVYGRLRALYR